MFSFTLNSRGDKNEKSTDVCTHQSLNRHTHLLSYPHWKAHTRAHTRTALWDSSSKSDLVARASIGRGLGLQPEAGPGEVKSMPADKNMSIL